MVSAHLYIEGAETKEDQIRCREGFPGKLLEKLGYSQKRRMPPPDGAWWKKWGVLKISRPPSRALSPEHFVAMLIDSEDPVANGEKTWQHLKARDGWDKPDGAKDEQVLLMTTCMETWIVADRAALKVHYGHKLQESALPPPNDLENRKGRA